ncbi:MAG: AMP-binding protein, partial [bacterium]|nr:AMP-binding protein [bacterium]
DKTIHQLFEEHVERTPDWIRTVGSRQSTPSTLSIPSTPSTLETPIQLTIQITYRELNEKSNHLASILQNKGVEPGALVGIKTERSVEMMTAILAVLKAGGAYLPIDPEYPSERIGYMMADSNTAILITGFNEIQALEESKEVTEFEEPVESDEPGIEVIDINTIYQLYSSTVPRPPAPGKHSTSGIRHPASGLAYVIYTSGSTGKPKGVMIQHSSLLNFIKGMTDIIPFTPEDSILSLTTMCFDIFGLETLLPLTTGTKIVIGNRTEQREPYAAGLLMEQESITLFQATPSRLQL